eukprot:9074664-Pyramimonas_sp.AAC.1
MELALLHPFPTKKWTTLLVRSSSGLGGKGPSATTSMTMPRDTARHRVTVVHGPPGTGKTVYSVATMDAWADALPEGRAGALTA